MYVTQRDDDLVVTDNGETVEVLESLGVPLERAETIADECAKYHDVRLDDGRYYKRGPMKVLTSMIFDVICFVQRTTILGEVEPLPEDAPQF